MLIFRSKLFPVREESFYFFLDCDDDERDEMLTWLNENISQGNYTIDKISDDKHNLTTVSRLIFFDKAAAALFKLFHGDHFRYD